MTSSTITSVTTYEKGENPQVSQTKKYLSDNPEDKVYIVETIPNDDFNYDLVFCRATC